MPLNRYKWTYVRPNGGTSKVGLLHNPKKGHLLIYCDLKVLLVDNKVFGSDAYSFFLDDELCVIHLDRDKEGQFTYRFEIDTKSDTPLNRERKKTNRKNILYSLLSVLGLATFVGLVIVVGYFYNQYIDSQELKTYPAYADAQVYVRQDGDRYLAFAMFSDSIDSYYQKIGYFDTPKPIFKNGFPLQEGDQFKVKYAKPNPANNILLYDTPSKTQIKKYHAAAFQQYQTFYPTYSEAYCNCVLKIAYDLKAVEGYALFYHLKTLPSENAKYNKKNYEEFTESAAFLDKEVDCWGDKF